MMPHVIQYAQKWWQDLSLNKKGVIVIALPLAILLASLTSLYLHEQKAAALESKLQLALLNQRDIQTIHTQLLEASNGVRDYLLTGEKDFLANYVLANRKLPLMISELNLQLEDDVQKVRLNRIKPLVEKNLRHLNGLANSNLNVASDT